MAIWARFSILFFSSGYYDLPDPGDISRNESYGGLTYDVSWSRLEAHALLITPEESALGLEKVETLSNLFIIPNFMTLLPSLGSYPSGAKLKLLPCSCLRASSFFLISVI